MVAGGGWCEGEKVVHGQGVDLAAVRAAIFDFGAAYGFVAAGGVSNGPFETTVRDNNEKSIMKAKAFYTWRTDVPKVWI